MFLTGYIAGVHFVQALSKLAAGEVLPRFVSVGRSSEGDLDIVEHDDLEAAFDHVVIVLCPYAVVVAIEGDLFRWHVCRPDVPDDMVATIEMRAVVSAGTVATTTPTVESEDFDGEVFFDGFAAGLDAEDHAFAISFGTLDMMANLMLKRPVTAQELQ